MVREQRDKIVISCFDRTANMLKPWANAGFTCYAIDLQHKRGEHQQGNIFFIGTDILDWKVPTCPVKIAFFFTPCTDVAVSGARWFKEKGISALINALRLFERSIEIAKQVQAPWMIENPVSSISSYWRAPDYYFNPWEYGDMYSKKTCLWTGGGFVMPEPIYSKRPGIRGFFNVPTKQINESDIDTKKIHWASGKDRANFRSETPMGFSEAVFKANY